MRFRLPAFTCVLCILAFPRAHIMPRLRHSTQRVVVRALLQQPPVPSYPLVFEPDVRGSPFCRDATENTQ